MDDVRVVLVFIIVSENLGFGHRQLDALVWMVTVANAFSTASEKRGVTWQKPGNGVDLQCCVPLPSNTTQSCRLETNEHSCQQSHQSERSFLHQSERYVCSGASDWVLLCTNMICYDTMGVETNASRRWNMRTANLT